MSRDWCWGIFVNCIGDTWDTTLWLDYWLPQGCLCDLFSFKVLSVTSLPWDAKVSNIIYSGIRFSFRVMLSFNRFGIPSISISINVLGFLIILSRKATLLVGFQLTLYGIYYRVGKILILSIIYYGFWDIFSGTLSFFGLPL